MHNTFPTLAAALPAATGALAQEADPSSQEFEAPYTYTVVDLSSMPMGRGQQAFVAESFLVHTAAEGLLAGLAGHAVGGWWVAWAAVAAAMAGHAFPLFARLRGGKAVMTFVGGGFALSPLTALAALGACLTVTLPAGFAWGARVGVFGFPVLQLLVDPVERAMGTGWLMAIIGALFGLGRLRGRRSGRASSARDAASRA